MRIGVVTTSYPRFQGDPAGNFVGGMARWLANRGHDVQVVAAGPEAPGEERDGHVRVSRIHAGADLFYGEGAPDLLERSLLMRTRAPVFSLALARTVARLAPKWDVVVSHWLVPSGLAAALAAPRCPHLAIAHSGDVHISARPVLADLVALALARRHTQVAFVADYLRDRMLAEVRLDALCKKIASASFTCAMGIDVAALALAGEEDPAGARHALGLPPDGDVILFLGRLVPIKGVRVLIDAVAHMRGWTRSRASSSPGPGGNRSEPVLLVAGKGPERERLEAHARARGVAAHFVGEVHGPRRDACLAAASVAVLPSIDLPSGRREGMPVVALEMLAASVPLVASDVGGVRDVAAAAARLVPPGDPVALANALIETLSPRDDQDNLRRKQAGREVAAAHDWDVICPRLFKQAFSSLAEM
ncbi:MAG: glycosyltransferase family 4 protein [Deltaproteobacteria bacterium]|nr:glycosyltransferase family 4 protein [Deltaproteobacteria bacterium]